MKKLLLLGVLVIGLILADKLVVSMNAAEAENNVASIDVLTIQAQLKKHVQYLTQLNPSRSSANVSSLNQAVDYIYKSFKSMGLQTRLQTFDVAGKSYHNVIALIGDPTKPRIVIGAHYDVYAEENPVAGQIFAGADGNASGVAGLIELARLVQKKQLRETDYAFEFVAYALEELPYFRTEHMGSYIHAQSLVKANVEVKMMISLEMIGYYSDNPDSQNYPIEFPMKQIYGDKGNFIALFGDSTSYFDLNRVQKLFEKASPLVIRKLSAPTTVEGIDWSDHMNYWYFGYPAVMLTDTSYLRNQNYHKITDTIETLNFEKMAQVVIGMENVVIKFR